jgi:hypothetical protein
MIVMKHHDYSIDEHLHRFAIWTAARAASKCRLSNQEISQLIEFISLREEIDKLRKLDPLTESFYRNWIHTIGNRMVEKVKATVYPPTKKENFKINNFTFGIAAKIISVYIKTAEVIPTKGESRLSIIAYPPVDSILLKTINLNENLGLTHQWSTLDWKGYEKNIDILIGHYGNIPMWAIEKDWKI